MTRRSASVAITACCTASSSLACSGAVAGGSAGISNRPLLSATHLAEELLALLATGNIGLLARLVSDAPPIVAHRLHRQVGIAEPDPLGLIDAGQGESAGPGGEDG